MTGNKRKRGRPPTGGVAVHLRFTEEVFDALEDYRYAQMPAGNRQDVIRELIRRQLAMLGYLPEQDSNEAGGSTANGA